MGPNDNLGRLVAYFGRHGETANNAQGRFRGQSNIPLDENGERDAENMGKFFAGKDIGSVYSSTKDRTIVTARAVADPKNLEVTPVAAFDPLNVGYLAGEKKEDHEHVMPFFQNNPDEKIPMGESINDFRKRTQPDLKKILKIGFSAPKPPLAVVHSSIIHEVNHMLTGNHNETLVKPGGVIAVYHHPTHGFKIKALLHPSIGASDSKYAG